jgi:ABC-type antimicrobial peptide transport system permease subunit
MDKQDFNSRHIPLSLIAYIAWKNLTHKKLRSFLTIFGVIIGIGAIFFLMSFGIGLRDLVTNEVVGGNKVNSIEITSSNSKIVSLDEKNVEKIKRLPHITQFGTSYYFAGSLSYKKSEVDSIVYGINAPYQELSDLKIAHGRLINDTDSNVAVVNTKSLVSINIKDTKKSVGSMIDLTIPYTDSQGVRKELNRSFRIIGVIDEGDSNEIFIPGHIFGSLGVSSYSQIKLSSTKTEYIPQLRKKVESFGFETSSPIDTVQKINEIFRFFTAMLVGFGGIGMIVAILGMFNTLTISLLERTKELGLMIALGGRNRDLKRLFILEAVILSVIGAVTGIILAVLFSFFVNGLMNNLAQSRGVKQDFTVFAFPPWLIVGLILFMIIIGLIVVYFPAKRAERINPIDALRRE